jgi:hypothetical protein
MGIAGRGMAFVRGFAGLALAATRGIPPGAIGLGVAASAVVLLTGAIAEGKSSYDSPYGYERTWNATLRLVRVDLGLKIVEKDDANGYVLFEYRSSEGDRKTTNGSFELVRGSSANARPDDVRVVAQLSQMPRYHEQVLLDSLARKMQSEYGEPPEPRPPAAPDAGAEKPEKNEESY